MDPKLLNLATLTMGALCLVFLWNAHWSSSQIRTSGFGDEERMESQYSSSDETEGLVQNFVQTLKREMEKRDADISDDERHLDGLEVVPRVYPWPSAPPAPIAQAPTEEELLAMYANDTGISALYTTVPERTEIRHATGGAKECLVLREADKSSALLRGCSKDQKDQRIEFTAGGLVRNVVHDNCLFVNETSLQIGARKCSIDDQWQHWTHEGPGFHRAGILRSRASPKLCLKKGITRQLTIGPCRASCQDLWLVGVKHQGHQSLQSEAPRMMYNHRVKNTGLRIACFVLTHPKNHATKARLINTTWGTRCNHLVFISTEPIPDMNTAVLHLDSPDSRQHLRTKGKFAYMHMYEHYLDKADWFLRADDDTYMIMENVKTYLETFSPHHLVVLGRRFFNNGKRQEPFNAGGPGVILSHAGMKLLGEKTKAGFKWAGPATGQGQDQQMGFTLTSLGVEVVDTRGAHGRHRFHPLHINIEHEGKASNPESDYWFNKFAPDTLGGHDCCVEDWVGTHYTNMPLFLTWDSMETSGCTNNPGDSPFLRLPLRIANATVTNLGHVDFPASQ